MQQTVDEVSPEPALVECSQDARLLCLVDMAMGQGHLLRILIDESDWGHDSLLYEAILAKAGELNLEKPSLHFGIMGFGWNRRIRRRRYWMDLLGLTQRCPVAIEVADADHRLAPLVTFVEEAVTEGVITLEEWDSTEAGEEWRKTKDGIIGEDVVAIAQFGRSAARLRVHFHPSAEPQSSSLHERLVRTARDMELMGATVFPDIAADDKTELHELPGFVKSRESRLIAEFVDDPAVIERFTHAVLDIVPTATLEMADIRCLRRSSHLPQRANG